jgi:hypothetical protein
VRQIERIIVFTTVRQRLALASVSLLIFISPSYSS